MFFRFKIFPKNTNQFQDFEVDRLLNGRVFRREVFEFFALDPKFISWFAKSDAVRLLGVKVFFPKVILKNAIRCFSMTQSLTKFPVLTKPSCTKGLPRNFLDQTCMFSKMFTFKVESASFEGKIDGDLV